MDSGNLARWPGNSRHLWFIHKWVRKSRSCGQISSHSSHNTHSGRNQWGHPTCYWCILLKIASVGLICHLIFAYRIFRISRSWLISGSIAVVSTHRAAFHFRFKKLIINAFAINLQLAFCSASAAITFGAQMFEAKTLSNALSSIRGLSPLDITCGVSHNIILPLVWSRNLISMLVFQALERTGGCMRHNHCHNADMFCKSCYTQTLHDCLIGLTWVI